MLPQTLFQVDLKWWWNLKCLFCNILWHWLFACLLFIFLNCSPCLGPNQGRLLWRIESLYCLSLMKMHLALKNSCLELWALCSWSLSWVYTVNSLWGFFLPLSSPVAVGPPLWKSLLEERIFHSLHHCCKSFVWYNIITVYIPFTSSFVSQTGAALSTAQKWN